MNDQQRRLLLDQLDRKLEKTAPLKDIFPPAEGWIYSIRSALKMSLRQLGDRLQITPQSVKDYERREKEGKITLSTMREVGHALNMDLVYVFVPKEESLEQMLERRAYQVAREIVLKTSNNMRLEDQEVSKERLEQSIKSLAEEFKRKIPRNLWD